jgi:hypothetical protein
VEKGERRKEKGEKGKRKKEKGKSKIWNRERETSN